MRTIVLIPPAEEPVSLAEAKLHLREGGDDQDPVIQRGIRAARESIESHTRRALMPRTSRTDWPGFPAGVEPIALPIAPVIEILSIEFTDADGLDRVLDPSAYRARPAGDGPAEIVPAIGSAWPATAPVPDALRVTYRAGYASAEAVPDCARSAILLRLGTLYESREDTVIGTVATPLSDIERWLLSPLDWGGYP